MGCITKRRSNYYNFIGAQRANGVVIGDLTDDVPFCTDYLPAPILFGAVDNFFEISLSWNDIPAASEYKIYRSLNDSSYTLIDTVSTLNYTDTPLDADTLYYYKIKSSNGVVDSPFSNTISLTTEDTIPAPSGLILSDIQLESIQLDWTSNSLGGEDGFEVERSLTEIGGYSTITTTGTGVTTYVDDTPPLDHNTTYYYKVRAIQSGVFSDYSDIENATTLLMAAPSDLILTPTLDSVGASWTSNSGGEEDGFDLEASANGVDGWSVVDSVGSGVTTGEETGLLQSTDRYYRVRATEAQGNSAYSSVVMTTTLTLEAPTLLIASLPSAPSKIQLDWTSNSGGEEDGFSIERSLTGVGAWSEVGTTDTNIVTFTNKNNVLPLTDYYYRVKATRTSGDSAYSNIDDNQIVWIGSMFGYYEFNQIDYGSEAPTLEEFTLVDGSGDTLVDASGDNISVLKEP